ncbi:hypothetical protein Vretimale_13392, partial [Volvox reticuliferus]
KTYLIGEARPKAEVGWLYSLKAVVLGSDICETDKRYNRFANLSCKIGITKDSSLNFAYTEAGIHSIGIFSLYCSETKSLKRMNRPSWTGDCYQSNIITTMLRRQGALPQRAALINRVRPALPIRSRTAIVVRAEGNGRNSDGFLAGMVVGGVVFGALGFLFAPQISKALLGDDQRLKLPRFLEDEQPKDPEQTKQDLIEKIAQLNASIDEVAAQLKVKEGEPLKMESSA